MLAALIIVFREVIEAGLVIGIVLAVTHNVPFSRAWIAGGVVAGIVASCIIAAFTGALAAAFEGAGQELFNAAILAVAVIMLGWHNVWMARHGREIAGQLKGTGEAVAAGARTAAALALVVGIAVLREGAEVVLFLYGVAIANGGNTRALALGGVIGLVLGGAVSGLTYFGLLRLPPRYLFAVTSSLIAFLAAGLAAQCISFLEKAGVLQFWSETAWDTSNVLSQGSIIGRILQTLVGYSDSPSYLQVVVYLTVLATIFILMRALRPSQSVRVQHA